MVSSAYARRLKAGLGWRPPAGAPPLVDATQLAPFVQALPVPLKMRAGTREPLHVEIVESRHRYHPALPPSAVWAYRLADHPGQDRPLVIVAARNDPARVTWLNRLPRPANAPLLPPYLDLGLMMSGVAGHVGMDPYAAGTCSTHLHGAELPWLFDGHPVRVPGETTLIDPGEDRPCAYPNTQPGTTLWFHDHVMGVTTGNVYAGLVGMYLLRAEAEAEAALRLPGHDDPEDAFVHEIPLILGDRSFAADGRVIYGATFGSVDPVDPARPGHLFDQASEFKGDCITVNGAVWPFLEVEARRYRFRVVNAAASRFFRLVLRRQIGDDPLPLAPEAIAITQIGGDGGFLPAPYVTGETSGVGVVLAPGERADLIVDFAGHEGSHLLLRTEIRDESDNATGFHTVLEGNGGDLTVPAEPDSPLAQSLVLQLRVSEASCDRDNSNRTVGEDHLTEIVDGLAGLGQAAEQAPVRPLALDEQDRGVEPAQPEIVGSALAGPLSWYTPRSSPAEVVTGGDVEVWEFTNVSPDTHPIHLHLVQFLALSRRNLPGNPTGPTEIGVNESGWKDTLRVGTGQVTRFAVRFANSTGRYVWHCHILEHEDMGMMRPLIVQSPH